MKIETKFNIGDRVWTVDASTTAGVATIDVLSGEISGISIDKDNKINYFFEDWCVDYSEENIVAYNNGEELFRKIKLLDNKIKAKENKNDR